MSDIHAVIKVEPPRGYFSYEKYKMVDGVHTKVEETSPHSNTWTNLGLLYMYGATNGESSGSQIRQTLISDLESVSASANSSLANYLVSRCRLGTGTSEDYKTRTDLVTPVNVWNTNYYTRQHYSVLGYEDIGGVRYVKCRGSYTFAYGALNNTFSEIGLYYYNANDKMMVGSKIKDGSGNPTTLTVLSDEQLTVTYTLYIKAANTEPSTMGSSGSYRNLVQTGTLSVNSTDYAYSLYGPEHRVISRASSTSFYYDVYTGMIRTLTGTTFTNGSANVRIHTNLANTSGVISSVAADRSQYFSYTILPSNKGISFSYVLTLNPSLNTTLASGGNLSIYGLDFGSSSANTSYSSNFYGAPYIRFTSTPIVKAATERLTLSVTFTYQWDFS